MNKSTNLSMLHLFPEAEAIKPQAASATRTEGDRLFSAGDFGAAETIFGTLIENGAATPWNLFQFARAAVRQRHWPAALQRLAAAIAVPGAIPWAAFEQAQVLEATGAGFQEVAEAAAAFTAIAPKTLQPAHISTLARWAHAAFDARCHQAATVLYDFLVAREQGGALCRLRQADLRVNAGQPEAALASLGQGTFPPDLARWVSGVQARALIALGRDADAAAILRPLVAAAPENLPFLRMLFGVLERLDDRATLAAPHALLAGLAPAARLEFLLRAAAWCDDHEALAALHAEYPADLLRAHAPITAAAMHRAIQRGDFATADRLFSDAGGASLGAPALVAAILAACFTRRDWPRAETILRDSAALRAAVDAPELRLRELEFHCYTLRLDDAAALADAWYKQGTLPAIASGTVAALHAARFEWHRVIALLTDRVSHRMRVDAKPLLDAACAAARHTGAYAAVIAALDESTTQTPSPAAARVRDALLAECALRHATSPDEKLKPAEASLLATPAGRAAVLRAGTWLGPAAAKQVAGHIFVCGDSAYLLGAATALLSVVRHNPALREGVRFSLVCADDDQDFAQSVCQRIGTAFGVTIQSVAAGSFGVDQRLRNEWGLFTPGQTLADSAYWRIFMVRHLLRAGTGGRVLYLDADTIAGGFVASLLATRLRGRALAARAESPLPEVAEAARRLNIDPAHYFNSGVVLFDLDHLRAESCLADAEHAALQRQHLLTFHDQCALNLGYAGQVHFLPERFNRFHRGNRIRAAYRGRAVINHYMGRPKPWDTLYAGPPPAAWHAEFRMLLQLLLPSQMRRLLLGAISPHNATVIDQASDLAHTLVGMEEAA